MKLKNKVLSIMLITVLTLLIPLGLTSTCYATSKVYIPKTGTKYHSNPDCSNMSNPSEVTLEKAKELGYTPCSKCYSGTASSHLNKTSATIYVNKKLTLKLTGATIKSCKSSDTKIATVTNKGVITAKKAGTATITIIDTNKKTYKCKVTVKNS